MASRKILAVFVSLLVILFVGSIVGCGSSSKKKVDLVKTVKVYSGTTNPVIAGITVQLLNNDTGEQVVENGTPVEALSGADGTVTFTIEEGSVVGTRIVGGPQIGSPATDYVDSVQWNNRTTDQDTTGYLLKWVDIYLGSFYATGDNAHHAADGGTKGVFASQILYVGPNGPTDTGFAWQPVGCATVKYFDSTDTEETAVHYQYDNSAGLPTGGKVQTPAANGKFASFTLTPGKTTIKAYEYGTTTELTSASLPNVIGNMLASNDDSANIVIPSSYTYPTGAHPQINLATVYVTGATNPEASCTAQ
jgi:hypothetical protein